MRGWLCVVALMAASTGVAEPRQNTGRRRAAPLHTRQQAPQSRLTGGVSVRPTWTMGDSTFFLENSASLGLKIRDSVELGFNQDFNVTGLDSPTGQGELVWMDAFARVRFSDWWKSADETTSVSTDLRGYFPTNEERRNRGMLTQLRAGFSASRKISDSLSFGVDCIPILHIYDTATFSNADGETEANPVFENRSAFALRVALGGGLSLELPLHYYVTRYADVGEDTVKSAAWNHFLGFFPSLSLGVGDHVSLGMVYYSGNLISEGEYGYTLAEDFATGSFQLSLGLSL